MRNRTWAALAVSIVAATGLYLLCLVGGAQAGPLGQTGGTVPQPQGPAGPPAPTPVPPGVINQPCPAATGCRVDGYAEGVLIIIPPGALPRDARVLYVVRSASAPCPPQRGARVYFDLTIADLAGGAITQLNAPFTISASQANDIGICLNGQWTDITTGVSGGSATGAINHLTLFAVVNDPTAAQPAPAAAPAAGAGAAPASGAGQAPASGAGQAGAGSAGQAPAGGAGGATPAGSGATGAAGGAQPSAPTAAPLPRTGEPGLAFPIALSLGTLLLCLGLASRRARRARPDA